MRIRGVALGVAALLLVGQCAGNGDDSGPSRSERPPVAEPTGGSTGSAEPAGEGRERPGPRRTPTTRAPSPSASTSPGSGTALAALAALDVKGRAPMTGYDRGRFGQAWLDADRNGCDTRNDVLAEWLTDVRLEDNGCVVASGTYADPYTGARVDYRQGHGALLDVDHVVAMGNAWATGAFRWHIRKRAAFANDPLNLLPADSGANRQKGDGDAATWLPSYRPFRCSYVARQVAVKAKYGLWVTAPEAAAIERLLAECPGEPLTPDTTDAPTEVDHDITDPGAPVASPPPAAPVPFGGVGSVSFDNCDAARAAGVAPVRLGDPGYGRHLDRDGDGVGCE